MFTYKIFNNIAEDGLNILDGNDFHIDEIDPDSLIIRSQNLSNNDFNKSLKCIGRAGAGTNNIPVKDATDKGIVVFNTPGANANAVKELVVLWNAFIFERNYSREHLFQNIVWTKFCGIKQINGITEKKL